MSQVETNKDLLSAEATVKLNRILDKHKGEGAIINILNDTQELLGYVPYSAQKYISEKTGIPLAELYGIVTFYSRFSLNPVGKYKVSVCLGTACYVKDAQKVLERVEEKLGLKAGETSENGTYSIAATRCIGACGLAPVMTVNEDVYGKLTADEVDDILAKYV